MSAELVRAAPPTTMCRRTLTFWAASGVFLVAHGWVLASSAVKAFGAEALPGPGEAILAALQLGVVEAIVVGAPLALVFAAFMRRFGGGTLVRAAAGVAVLSAALALVLAGWSRLALDCEWASVGGVHLTIAVAAVLSGAAASEVLLTRSARDGAGV